MAGPYILEELPPKTTEVELEFSEGERRVRRGWGQDVAHV